jgi:glycosyltransferase involved in cell wall biosynthesis
LNRAAPLISVVIPTRDRASYLREALVALRDGELHEFEVLVMDQSEGDDSRDVVCSFNDDRLEYHRMPRPGACPARNLGAAIACSPLVAFLDDDCCPRPDWLRRIVDAFDSDGDLQFIFGQLSAPPHDENAGAFPEFRPSPSLAAPRNHRRLMTSAAGANMSCRKDFLRRNGGFDELLGPSAPRVMGNDSSIIYKVLCSGEKWLASPVIEVVHTNGFRTYEQFGPLLVKYAHGGGVNYGRFLRRGDLRAAWYFVLETRDILQYPLRSLLKLRRPRGLGLWLAYARGFLAGLRLPRRLGYADGAAIRSMEATGRLTD